MPDCPYDVRRIEKQGAGILDTQAETAIVPAARRKLKAIKAVARDRKFAARAKNFDGIVFGGALGKQRGDRHAVG